MISKKECHVLVTRPAEYAAQLAQKLHEQGFSPVICPLLKHHSVDFKLSAFELANFDIAIFNSPAAVKYTLPQWLIEYQQLPEIQWVAIGPGTARLLAGFGVSHIHVSTHPPYDSEQLLKLPILQNLKNKKIAVFRGFGGRNKLITTCLQKGAKVRVVAVYERGLPDKVPAGVQHLWYRDQIHIVVATSQEIVANLLLSFEADLVVTRINLLVVSERIALFARCLGFEHIFVARSVTDSDIMMEIEHIWSHYHDCFKK